MSVSFTLHFEIKTLYFPAIRHCWKHMQHPGTAWNNAPWGHCPLSQGEKFHRLDRPLWSHHNYDSQSMKSMYEVSWIDFKHFEKL